MVPAAGSHQPGLRQRYSGGEVIFSHRDYAGIHFTGSTGVFRTSGRPWVKPEQLPVLSAHRWRDRRKDFIIAHSPTNAQVVTALTRGAFEYQGQNVSAVSRAYLPKACSRI